VSCGLVDWQYQYKHKHATTKVFPLESFAIYSSIKVKVLIVVSLNFLFFPDQLENPRSIGKKIGFIIIEAKRRMNSFQIIPLYFKTTS